MSLPPTLWAHANRIAIPHRAPPKDRISNNKPRAHPEREKANGSARTPEPITDDTNMSSQHRIMKREMDDAYASRKFRKRQNGG